MPMLSCGLPFEMGEAFRDIRLRGCPWSPAISQGRYGRQRERHSGLMLAARITLRHFSVSAAMNFPNSLGELGNMVAPSSAIRVLILGSASAALISLLSLSIISAGVSFGTPTPFHALAS